MMKALTVGILLGSVAFGGLEQKQAPRVHVSEAVANRLMTHSVQAVCPVACNLCERAEVKLKLIVSKGGTVKHVTVVRADSRLADAASDAVKAWRFRRYILNGVPVEYETYATVNSWRCGK